MTPIQLQPVTQGKFQPVSTIPPDQIHPVTSDQAHPFQPVTPKPPDLDQTLAPDHGK